jgi:hypothetical protein
VSRERAGQARIDNTPAPAFEYAIHSLGIARVPYEGIPVGVEDERAAAGPQDPM